MPFVREVEGQWRPCATVDLRQLPERRTLTTTFEVLDEFGYTGRPPDGRDARGPVWSPAAVEHVVPAGFVTDLASVPALLWGVIASYGRQTLPAVLHDVLYDAARRAGTMRTGRRLRREADVLFRATLRENGAGPVRQWLMWAAVRTFGSPIVVVPLVALAVALLVLGAVAWAEWYAVVPIAGAAAMVAGAGTLAAAAMTSVEEDGRGGSAFRPRAFLSLVLACVVALVATLPVVVVMVVTAAVRAVVEVGERPAAEASGDQPAAATARITWSPLLARLPDMGRKEGSDDFGR